MFSFFKRIYYRRKFKVISQRPGFCVKPWTFLAMKATGHYAACCWMIPGDKGVLAKVSEMTPSEYFHSSTYKKLLRLFENKKINTELSELCKRCHSYEKDSKKSPRLEANNWLKSKEKYIMTRHNYVESKLDPHFIPKNIGLDISILGNRCNLRCYMCYPFQSTSIGEERLKYDELKDREKPIEWSLDTILGDDNLDPFWEDLGSLLLETKFINFGGGEPFLLSAFEKVLDVAIEKDVAKYIEIFVSTNGTFQSRDRNKRILGKLAKFKKVLYKISIDGLAEKNEYVRYPAKWKDIIKNVALIREVHSAGEICFSTSISALSVSSVLAVHEFCRKEGISYRCRNIVNYPSYLQAMHLPEDVKVKLIQDFSKANEKKYDHIIEILKKPRDQQEWERLTEYLDKLDRWRGTRYLDLWPELEATQELHDKVLV